MGRVMPNVPVTSTLELIMRSAVFALALVIGSAYAGEDCSTSTACGHWTTKRTYPGGTIRLNWTHVYEGKDTVFRIDFPSAGSGPKELKVEGQPVFNKETSLVALPYCADDGCSAKVPFVDLVSRREIAVVTLPYDTQIYLDGKWRGDSFVVKVSLPDGKGAERVVTHRYRVTPVSVVEQK